MPRARATQGRHILYVSSHLCIPSRAFAAFRPCESVASRKKFSPASTTPFLAIWCRIDAIPLRTFLGLFQSRNRRSNRLDIANCCVLKVGSDDRIKRLVAFFKCPLSPFPTTYVIEFPIHQRILVTFIACPLRRRATKKARAGIPHIDIFDTYTCASWGRSGSKFKVALRFK